MFLVRRFRRGFEGKVKKGVTPGDKTRGLSVTSEVLEGFCLFV